MTERIDVEKIFARHPFARVILERLIQAGHEAVLIGGVVRDALRARPEKEFEPQEVDIATSALPEEIEALFGEFPIVEVGKAFGVLKIVGPQGASYEVATFRTEGEYDGRWPKRVELVRSLEQDVQRRDFTVNGLAARADGTVIDLVGGLEDLKRRVIRAIGDPDERFREDYLRLLRAIRFACLLDAELEPCTSRAIRSHREGLRVISAERIRDELIALLRTPRSSYGVKLLDEHGLLELILPELTACKGVPQPEEYHPEGDVFTHTLLALKEADRFIADPLVKLALLLHDLGKPEALKRNRGENASGHEVIGAEIAEKICRKLRLSNAEVELIVFLVKEHQRIGHLPEMGWGKQVKFLKTHEQSSAGLDEFTDRFPWYAKLLQLMIADCQASAMRSKGWLPVLRTTTRLLIHLRELERLTRARKLIDGHDLIRLGVPQGPELGRILEELYERIFAGEIKNRKEALEHAKRLVAERKSKRG